MRKKLICCILVLIFILPCFSGCKFMTLSNEEAKAELEKLLPMAKELTVIFYGEGLPYHEIDENSSDYYAFIKKDAPYQSIAQLKDAAAKVFSEEYLVSIYEYAFEGTEYYASRYFMAKDDSGADRLKINTKLEPMSMLQDIDLSTAKVIEGTPATVVVEVSATTSTGKQIKKEITMVNENGRWLLDCAAY